jgi:uncharacterized protein
MSASPLPGDSQELESFRHGQSSARVGDWIQTFSGLVMYPLDPRVSEICIEDITHALSNLCRFTGHTKTFYSVAEHSVRVSWECDPADALWGLLHDASEAYLADMSRPMKRSPGFGPIYMEAEARLMRVICLKFGLSPECPESVKVADTRLLMTEKRDLMHGCNKPWEDVGEPLKARIQVMAFGGKYDFEKRFAELTSAKPSPVEPSQADVKTNPDRGQ